MKATKSSSLVVEKPEALRVLSDPVQMRFFVPFLARDLTVSQAAEETGSSVNSMYARVRRYLRVGLLKVVREIQREGRAVKVYRSVADELVIHDDFSLEAHLRWHGVWERQIYQGLSHVYADRFPVQSRIYRNEKGVFSMDSSLGDGNPLALGQPAVFTGFHDALRLDYADAKALQSELSAIWRKYLAKKGGQSHLLRLVLVPLPPEAEIIP